MVGMFPKETSATTLATEIMLWSSEEWALKRYFTMDKGPRNGRKGKPTTFETLTYNIAYFRKILFNLERYIT